MTEPESPRWFELEPADAWFFGDGRPSHLGEDQSDLTSVFPPPAPTVVGALRAALARQAGWPGRGQWPDRIKQVLGDGFDDLGALRFTGPFLKRYEELLFPMPAHVLGKVGPSDRAQRFNPQDWLRPEAIRCDRDRGEAPTYVPAPPPPSANATNRLETPSGWLVTQRGLDRIRQGQLPEAADCWHRDDLFRLEPRVGIALDEDEPSRRTTGQGALYSPHYVRLRDGVSLAIGVAGLPSSWTPPQLFPLGGESRLAGCREIAPPGFPGHRPVVIDGDCLVVLLTPAHFGAPCWYGAGPGDDASALRAGMTGRVVTAAIDRPESVGGWDSINRRSRALAPFAPRGSVWWLASDTTSRVSATRDRIGGGPMAAYGYGEAVYARPPDVTHQNREDDAMETTS